MKKHEHRQETEAVARGHGPEQEERGHDHADLPDFDISNDRQRTSSCAPPAGDMFYTRYGNPTHTVVEKAIAELEGTDAALLFASGMGAVTTSLMALLQSGNHVVAQRDIYGGVTKFLSKWLPKMGIETTLVDTTEYEQHAAAIKANTKLLYLESPTNPLLRVVDCEEDCRAGQAARTHLLHR